MGGTLLLLLNSCVLLVCRKLRQNDERCRALPELINEVFVLLKHDLDLGEDDALAKTAKKKKQIKGLICLRENRKRDSTGHEAMV